MIYRFVKLADKWFIDIPDWTGDINELQMVMGAETLLENVSKIFDFHTEREVTLDIFQEHETNQNMEHPAYVRLSLMDIDTEGATYLMDDISAKKYNMENNPLIWLCNVTKFLFDIFPYKLYILI